MPNMNRRDFLRRSAGAAALSIGGAYAPAAQNTVSPATPLATTPCPLGHTGLTSSFLGMGTGTQAWGGSSAQNRMGRQSFVNLLRHACDRGISYFDLADMYGAHDYIKELIRGGVQREQLLLLTKTVSRVPALVRADLERFRKELDVDTIDILLLHCLVEPDWTENLGHTMEVLGEAKDRGQIRAHGVSCHNIDALRAASIHPWVDVILARINPFGVKMDGPPEDVAPILQQARANGKCVIGMKILGEGTMVSQKEESLRFALNLGCLHAMTIGFQQPHEIDAIIDAIEAARA